MPRDSWKYPLLFCFVSLFLSKSCSNPWMVGFVLGRFWWIGGIWSGRLLRVWGRICGWRGVGRSRSFHLSLHLDHFIPLPSYIQAYRPLSPHPYLQLSDRFLSLLQGTLFPSSWVFSSIFLLFSGFQTLFSSIRKLFYSTRPCLQEIQF